MNKINYKLINLGFIFLIIFCVYNTYNIWGYFINIIKIIVIVLVISIFLYYLLLPIRKFFSRFFNKLLSSIFSIVILFLFLFLFFRVSLPIIIKESYNIYNILINNSYFYNYVSKYFDDIFLFVFNFIDYIFYFILVVIITFYLLYNDVFVFNFLKGLINDKFYLFLKSFFDDLECYIKSLGLIVIIEIVEYTLYFLLIGHPYFYLLGFLFGMANLIPYFGSFVCSFLVLVSAISVSKTLFIFSSIGCLIIPIFDNYVIDPRVYGKSLNISFIKMLLIIIVSKLLFGVVGMVFSILFYIFVKNIVNFYIKK